MEMRDASKCNRVRNSILRSSAILDFSEPKFLSLVGSSCAKQLRNMMAVGPIVFRLHRFEDVALLTDG
jgi:hypothetical protein